MKRPGNERGIEEKTEIRVVSGETNLIKVGNTSYRDISVVVAENNSIVKPISAPYNTTILDHVTGARLSCTNK